MAFKQLPIVYLWVARVWPASINTPYPTSRKMCQIIPITLCLPPSPSPYSVEPPISHFSFDILLVLRIQMQQNLPNYTLENYWSILDLSASEARFTGPWDPDLLNLCLVSYDHLNHSNLSVPAKITSKTTGPSLDTSNSLTTWPRRVLSKK